MQGDEAVGNLLLGSLPGSDWDRIRGQFSLVELRLDDRPLAEVGEPISRVYFPITGLISAVHVFSDGATAEMATVGCEGMSPVAAVMGADRAIATLVAQAPGRAWAIELAAFRRLCGESARFRATMLAFAQAFTAQLLQSVACNSRHSVEERAARWLLMSHDRAEGDTFPLTQEFLAAMLGVSRAAVGTVARGLAASGAIRHARGSVTVLNRSGLERASCECYGIIRRHYEQRLSRLLAKSKEGAPSACGGLRAPPHRYVKNLADGGVVV
jgi:CRP-like cAMP-binding protein